MSLPGKYDMSLYRGDSYTWRVVLWQDEAQTLPTDLTGATVASEIRNAPAGDEIIALACVVTPPNTIDLALTADMWPIAPRMSAVWDLQITYPTGEVRTVLAGKVSITADVTESSL